MSIVIPIISEFNSKGIDRARKEFGQLETVGQKAQYGISAASAALVGSLGAVVATIGHAIKAAADDQKSQEQLKIALQNTTGATDFQVKAVEDVITQMMYQTATADDELRPALGKLVRATGDVTQAQKLLALGLDISAGSGKSLDAVTTALSKAAMGNFTALKRLGIPLDENAVKTKDLDAITAQLGASFAGAAKKNAQTFEGQMKTLNLALGEVKEKVGRELIPVLTDYAIVLAGLLTDTSNLEKPTNRWVELLKSAADKVTDAITGTHQLKQIIGFVDGWVRGAAEAQKQLNRQTSAGHALVKTTTELVYGATEVTKRSSAATEAAAKADAKAKEAKAKLAEAAKKLAADLKTARDALTEQFAEALKGVTDKLEAAQAKFNDFAKSVSSGVMSAINFGSAQNDAQDNVKNLSDALKGQAEAQKKLAKTMAGTDIEAQTEAMQDLVEANFNLEEARKKPMSFFDNLKKQAVKAKDFGVLVNRLIAGGISEQALAQVLDAGVDAGTSIAQEILSGGQEAISGPEGINTIVSAAQDLADKTGELAAKKFYQAGVDAGLALVKGMQSIIDKYTPMMNAPGISPSGVAGLGVSFAGEAGGITDGNGGVDLSGIDWSSVLAGVTINVGGLATLASGGIVTSPTIALIGEGGQPEAVVPLDRMGSMGGGTQVTINVNGGDPNAVVDALRTYMRQNGSVPIRVSTP